MISKDIGTVDDSDKQYPQYNYRLFNIVGLWPYQNTPKQLYYIYFINMLQALAVSSQISMLFIFGFKMELIIELMQTLLPTLLFVSCYCNLRYHLSAVKKVFDRIRCDWIRAANEQELFAMQKYAKQTRVWILFITYLCYAYVIFLICPSMMKLLLFILDIISDADVTLPVNIEFFLKDEMHYFFALLLEFIIICIVATLGVVHYSIFVSFLQHVRALFTITLMKIDRPFKRNSLSSYNMRSFTTIEKEHDWIISVIRCYDESIKFVDIIKSIFGKIYLMEVAMALLFIIIDFLYLFQLLTLTSTITDAVRDCAFISASLLVIYAYCYLGQKLIDHNTDIFITCCHVPFYTLSLKTQKVLFMLIIKTMRPCNFSVTRMIVTSHELFANLIRTSFSYALVFYNVF